MDAKVLRESFELIETTKEAFAHDFYTRLFSRYPALRELFVQDMYIQERSLILTLQMIVQTAEQEDDLFPILYKLGLRHQTYGVKAEHYPLLGVVLIDTFSTVLGESFTVSMAQAWREAYAIISAEMQHAADSTIPS